MASPKPSAFQIGIICPLPIERAAVQEVLDVQYDDPKARYPNDTNTYSLGTIGNHNVVIAGLPAGATGLNAANSVAGNLIRTFTSVKVLLCVGIGGGVWTEASDVRIGDIVVSEPSGVFGGVEHYNFGKAQEGGRFEKTSFQRPPPEEILTALSKLKANFILEKTNLSSTISMFQQKPAFRYLGAENDRLFETGSIHNPNSRDCSECDLSKIIERHSRTSPFVDDVPGPAIHYGLIASADHLMKDSNLRDSLNKSCGGLIRCFEMQAAGLMNSYPCLVIRGISNYCDSHKRADHGWHGWAAAMAAAYARELIKVLPLNAFAEELTWAENSNKPDYQVTFSLRGVPVVERFVGRASELQQLEDALISEDHQGRQKTFVLHGLGGIGKTQLAIEFATLYQSKYDSVFWLDGRTKESLKNSLLGVGRRLPQDQLDTPIPETSPTNNEELNAIVKNILKWFSLRENTNWLLIFDNVDRDPFLHPEDPDAYDLENYIPESPHGSILITTRLSRFEYYGKAISRQISRVDRESALEMLSNSCGNAVQDWTKVNELIGLLDGLPLAISQAGAFIRQTGCSISEYVEHCTKDWSKLMDLAKGFGDILKDYSGRSIVTTWFISYEAIMKVNESAAFLLRLWAFLGSREIWLELLTSASNLDLFYWPNLSKSFQEAMSNRIDFLHTTQTLLSYSLIDSKQHIQEFSIHPVVHEWIHNWIIQSLHSDAKLELQLLAIYVTGKAVPSSSQQEYWILQQKLLPHASRCILYTRDDNTLFHLPLERMDNRIFSSITLLGDLYTDQDKLEQAEEMYQRALEGYEKALGPEHASNLNTVNNLGALYRNQGKLEQAEEMYQRALEGYEKALGPEHVLTLNPVHNLGALYKDQGKLQQAEEMYQRALEGYEKALSPEHSLTLNIVNNLGVLYQEQGKLEQAEEMYQRALEGKEKALGPEHVLTLSTVHNLGVLYIDQGKLEQAEEMYQRALEGHKKALGPEHSLTLTTVNNLGVLYSTKASWSKLKRCTSRHWKERRRH